MTTGSAPNLNLMSPQAANLTLAALVEYVKVLILGMDEINAVKTYLLLQPDEPGQAEVIAFLDTLLTVATTANDLGRMAHEIRQAVKAESA